MTFSEVSPALEQGKKIRLAAWKNAYWYKQGNQIMNHFEEGKEVPAKTLYPRDLIWVLTGDWEVVPDDQQTPDPKDGLFDFTVALDLLKKGQRVARKGWNGKGMFIVLTPGNNVPAKKMRLETVRDYFEKSGQERVTINPHIDMKAADGSLVIGWLASQTDLLADDWMIV